MVSELCPGKLIESGLAVGGEGGKGTELELSHGVFETQEDRDLHEQGWFACITCLDRFLEEEEG